MGSGKRTWGFRANSKQNEVLKRRVEEHDETRTEAVKHYITLGIEAEQSSDEPARAEDASVLKVLVAQMAVGALAILMMGPGMDVIPRQSAWYVSIGLVVLALWTLVAMRFGWITRAQDRIEAHIEWAIREAEVDSEDHTPEADA